MHMRIRERLTILVGIITVPVLLFGWTRPRGQIPPENSPFAVFPEEPEGDWVGLGGEERGDVLREVAHAAVAQWIEAGIEDERAAALSRDLATVLASIVTPDFDRYDAFMRERGAELNELAAGFSEYLFTSTRRQHAADGENEVPRRFPEEEVGERFRHAGVRDRLRHMWNNPERRDCEWVAVAPGSLRAGIGLDFAVGSPEWPGPSAYVQESLYRPAAGRLTWEAGRKLEGTTNSAWVQLHVRFSSGFAGRVRLVFFHDETSERWIPFAVAMEGAPGIRPMPML